MQIITDDGFVGEEPVNVGTMLRYRDGSMSVIPHGFFDLWGRGVPDFGTFHIGKNVVIGEGSTVRYESGAQCLRIGRYFSGGMRVRFILNGTHNLDTISTWSGLAVTGLPENPREPFGDTRIGNDVWVGEETMILGGATIGDGCVIGARSLVLQQAVLEPYGIYAGHPARLIRFRFPPEIIGLLLAIRWWDMPLDWMRAHSEAFRMSLNADPVRAAEILAELRQHADRVREHLRATADAPPTVTPIVSRPPADSRAAAVAPFPPEPSAKP